MSTKGGPILHLACQGVVRPFSPVSYTTGLDYKKVSVPTFILPGHSTYRAGIWTTYSPALTTIARAIGLMSKHQVI